MLPIIGIIILIGIAIWIRAMKKNTDIWYPVPFEKGEAYLATETIIGDFDRIEKGSVLVYDSTGFSRYDGYIGFFFIDSAGKKRRWDLSDALDPVAEAKKSFQKSIK